MQRLSCEASRRRGGGLTAAAPPSGRESGVGTGGEFLEGIGVRQLGEADTHRRLRLSLGQLYSHLGEPTLFTVEVWPRPGTHTFAPSVARSRSSARRSRASAVRSRSSAARSRSS